METQKETIPKPLKQIKIIYNNDCAVMDFLSDLKDREPVHALERYIHFSDRKNACLLVCCKEDGIVVLVLYNAPLGLNQGENRLMLYAYNDIPSLCRYFRVLLAHAEDKEKDLINAYNDILRLCYYQWAVNNEDKDVQVDFLG